MHLVSHLRTKHTVFGTCHQYNPNGDLVSMEITNLNKVQKVMDELTPDIVIHSAALANPAKCYENPSLAEAINVLGSHNIAKACALNSVRMIHISTDMVFDGNKGDYDENETPSPINVYGKTKATAECVVLNTLATAAVLRTAIVYGTGSGMHPNFFERLMKKISHGPHKILADEFRSFVYVEDVAIICDRLASGSHNGIFHIGGQKSSRYKFVCRMLDHFGIDKRNILPVTIQELNEESPRPADLSLNCSKTMETVQFSPASEVEGFIKFEKLLDLK